MVPVAGTIWAVLIAAGVPSAVFGLLMRKLQKKMDKKDEEQRKREEARKENELLQIKLMGASLALSEATAEAVQRIPDAHCNGDMHQALAYAREVKHKHKDLLYEQAVDHLS